MPPRDPKADKQMLDLSAFYNAALSESWHGGTENDLAALPAGLQTLDGVKFDIRGIVQLRSKSPSSAKYPAAKQANIIIPIATLANDTGAQVSVPPQFTVCAHHRRLVIPVPAVFVFRPL